MKEYYEDDRIIIPDSIKNMSREERQAEIKRMEDEAQKEKMLTINECKGNEKQKMLAV